MDSLPNPDNIALDLEGTLREVEDEQAARRRLRARVEKYLTLAAFEEFPALRNMSADQIREFGDVVTRAGHDFALQSANLAYAAERT